jgi:hypothetical protein
MRNPDEAARVAAQSGMIAPDYAPLRGAPSGLQCRRYLYSIMIVETPSPQ